MRNREREALSDEYPTFMPFIRSVVLARDEVPSFDVYPYNLPAIRELRELQFTSPVTFFVGENGTGKSTLLEAIAVAWGFNAEGGSKNFNFNTRASHSDLYDQLRLMRSIGKPRDGFFLRAESFFNLATEIERLDEGPGSGSVGVAYGGRKLHEQSHGESFMALLVDRFFGTGLYLLDEPEAALSPTRQLALILRIHELVGCHSQFIIATHSPIVLAYPGAQILGFSESGIQETTYRETEHFAVAHQFLRNPEGMLEKLLRQSRV